MVAVFCLRLGCGMLATLLLLPMGQVNPRFFRVHFLTCLGLTAVATVFLRDQAGPALWLVLSAAMACAFLGSLVWHLEGSPAGKTLILLTVPLLAAGLWFSERGPRRTDFQFAPYWGDHLTSAALLGSAMTAMLIGHSYLIAPAMSLSPLFRMLKALGVCLFARMGLAGIGLWLWTGRADSSPLETEMVLWLAVRWGLGFVVPLVLGWMAWETARIRSTQSATGILYVVVIVCFLGELTSQLLLDKTGYIL